MTQSRRSMPFLTSLLGFVVATAGWLSPARAADPASATPVEEGAGATGTPGGTGTAGATAALPKVTVRFDKTSVEDVTKRLHELSGYDFVVGHGVQGEVTASFTDQPLDKLLRTIGLALSLQVEQRDKTFVIRPVDPIAATLPASDLGGAGALLPGDAATKPLAEAGTALPLAGATATADGRKPTNVTTGQIALNHIRPDVAAALLGAGYVDGNGVYHSPDELQAQLRAGQNGGRNGTTGYAGGDPYANLPPDARVTANGTILLPNGSTVLPNGTLITRDGTVVTPPQQTPNYSVPWGTNLGAPGVYRPGQFPGQQPTGPVMQGNLGGVPFMIGPNGNTLINPSPIVVGGGLGQIYLPPIVLGGQGNGQGYQGYQGNPFGYNTGTGYYGPTVYWNTTPPNVHYGNPPVGASGWSTTPPAGMQSLMSGTAGTIGTPVGKVVDPKTGK